MAYRSRKNNRNRLVGADHHCKDDEYGAKLIAEYADRFTDQLHIAMLDEHIERLETRMTEIVEGHKGLHSYGKLLKSIPGVAEVTT